MRAAVGSISRLAAVATLLLAGFAATAQTPVSVPKTAAAPTPKVVGYFPQWGVYNGFFLKNLVTSGSAPLLTQVDYAFAEMSNNQCVSVDAWADFQKPLTADQAVNGIADSGAAGVLAGNFNQLAELKKLYPKLKVVLSIGGGSANPALFSVAAQPANRTAFVKSCVDMFVQGNFAPGLQQAGIFDGFDIDWEYPATAADKTNFTGLLAEFRKQLDAVKPGLTLTIAAPAGSWAYQYIDLNAVQQSLDFFGLMAYDFDGPWNKATGFVAPAVKAPSDPSATNNGAAAVWAYLRAGVAPSKIVFGVPFYGYEWTDVPDVNHGLFQTGTPVGQGSGFNQIVPLASTFTQYRDATTGEPWMYDGTNFWTYDDPISLGYKATAVRVAGLGGVMAWSLSGDTANGDLLKSVARYLQPE